MTQGHSFVTLGNDRIMLGVINKENPVICWWSGGVTSAVACKLAIDLFGVDNCRVIMIDTGNEDDDTYRFQGDCAKWFGLTGGIETISSVGEGSKYSSIEDVWYDFESLNVATGAICSATLKREVRVDFQRRNKFSYQVFGFDIDESRRAKNIKKSYPASMPIFPLMLAGYTKKDCIKIIQDAGIEIPRMYHLGFHNNNCFKTGCVQGGIGYWQKIMIEFPEKFEKMASVEHELTDLKGKPVTCLRDQSNAAKKSGVFNVFLKPHPDYPNHKDITMMKGRPVEPLVECNGFCGTFPS